MWGLNINRNKKRELGEQIRKYDLAGVKSSSHSSTPMQVSVVLTTASPNGTFT